MSEMLTPWRVLTLCGQTLFAGIIWYRLGPGWGLGFAAIGVPIVLWAVVGTWRGERHARVNAKAGFHKGQRLQRLEPWWDGWKGPRPEPRLVTYEGPGLSEGYQVVRYDDDPYDHWCKTEHLVPAPLPAPFCPEEATA